MERLKKIGGQLSSHPLKYFGLSSLIQPEHQVHFTLHRLFSIESKPFA